VDCNKVSSPCTHDSLNLRSQLLPFPFMDLHGLARFAFGQKWPQKNTRLPMECSGLTVPTVQSEAKRVLEAQLVVSTDVDSTRYCTST
jgi:hypothetical protein